MSTFARLKKQFLGRCQRLHARVPYASALPLPAVLIVIFLIIVNLVVWAICGIVLASRPHFVSTAAIAYSLGLRHALDADHISAIDLMTRRLIATGQRPVTVGTFFSLGHSTIVVITSIVVAATAASVSAKFDGFGRVGGIIGTSVSAAFLIVLGILNAYILHKLVVQMKKVIRLSPEQEVGKSGEAWKIEGGGVIFSVLKKVFKFIDRPWKMYPLGVLFGLGFDTSSEVALLGIASIHGSQGTSIWLILIFPVLFTVGMCLIDTIDGALMSSLYLAPLSASQRRGDEDKKLDQEQGDQRQLVDLSEPGGQAGEPNTVDEEAQRTEGLTPQEHSHNLRLKSPLTFLYYSIVLTSLTVVVALVIGVIQLLSLILNVAVSEEEAESNRFWHGVEMAGEYYDVIGGAICASFVVFGGLSVLCYRPWRRWVDKERLRLGIVRKDRRGLAELIETDTEMNANTNSDQRTARTVTADVTPFDVARSSTVPATARSDIQKQSK